ncbi:glycosyl transferase family 2 [Nitrosococcus halophilus Nc 4]|uniref:Glycosyl transferase family 2 n=1 Tax=Nitrosococcus halophilus (strain Nc4) TaxID=472759 RepID=D5C0N3_NITHN|nr:glycosyltransferase [Nitrosococcus halophilus]ADE16356.1 glycosyl transferase family 2 [Nitrosococcus halophilus Nc 4]
MEHIAVCIATFKRPQLLENLLNAIANQVTGKRFLISVIVVDNDAKASAQEIAKKYTNYYFVVPEQNIALARNRAATEAIALGGDFIAIIDDDQVPIPDWLFNLYKAIQGMDIVHGPVCRNVPETPFFRVFFSRRQYDRHKGSGNCLIRTRVFQELQFDPSFGISGGEDSDFFYRAREAKFNFVWAPDAMVTEIVPPHRMTIRWVLARSFRGGNSFIRLHRKNSNWKKQLILFWMLLIKLFIDLIYIPIMPVMAVVSPLWFWRQVRKSFAHLGQLTAFLNYVHLEYR